MALHHGSYGSTLAAIPAPQHSRTGGRQHAVARSTIYSQMDLRTRRDATQSLGFQLRCCAAGAGKALRFSHPATMGARLSFIAGNSSHLSSTSE